MKMFCPIQDEPFFHLKTRFQGFQVLFCPILDMFSINARCFKMFTKCLSKIYKMFPKICLGFKHNFPVIVQWRAKPLMQGVLESFIQICVLYRTDHFFIYFNHKNHTVNFKIIEYCVSIYVECIKLFESYEDIRSYKKR